MVRLIAYTQVRENYNTESDDPSEAYWKNKFGSEYLVAELTIAQAAEGQTAHQARIEAIRPKIECNGTHLIEYIVHWELLYEGELTEDERMDLEFRMLDQDKVRHPHPIPTHNIHEGPRA